MSSLSIFFLIFSSFVFIEIIYFIFAFKNKLVLAHCVRVENTRAQFAVARNKLLKFAINKDLDANDSFFKHFYSLHTYILRRPDKYPEISENLLMGIIRTVRENKKSFKKNNVDVERYSEEMKEIISETVKGLDLIIFDHSFIRRITYRIEKKYGFFTFLAKGLMALEEHENKKSELNSLVEFKKDLSAYCHA